MSTQQVLAAAEHRKLDQFMATKKFIGRVKYAMDMMVVSLSPDEDLSRIFKIDVSTYNSNITLNCHRSGLPSITFSTEVPLTFGDAVEAVSPAEAPEEPAPKQPLKTEP